MAIIFPRRFSTSAAQATSGSFLLKRRKFQVAWASAHRTRGGPALVMPVRRLRVALWYEAEIALHGVRIGEALDLVEGSNEA